MQAVLELGAFTLLYYLFQELLRRSSQWIAWFLFLGLPFALLSHWIQADQDLGVFPWVKLWTMLFAVCYGTAIRFTALGKSRAAVTAAFLLLPANIMEAVVQDMSGGHAAHFLLAATGVLLIISVPNPFRAIRIDIGGAFRDLIYEEMTRPWIVGYTLWNWSFVYLNFPSIAGHQLSVLAAALLVGMIDPRRWLQARAYTLAGSLLFLFTLPQKSYPLADTTSWATQSRENFAAASCLMITAIGLARLIIRRRSGDSPSYRTAT